MPSTDAVELHLSGSRYADADRSRNVGQDAISESNVLDPVLREIKIALILAQVDTEI